LHFVIAIFSELCNMIAETMGRLLRSGFWLLVVATLITPIPMGESVAAQTPICCLGKGEHDCLGHVPGGDAGSLGLSAPSKCPYSPRALAAMHGPELVPPVQARLIVAVAQSAPIAQESNGTPSFLVVDTRPERGPPSFSL
jgi:hypothetical protein